MKKSILLLFICFFFTHLAHAQHFTGDMTLVNSNTAVFTVTPRGADITGKISLFEFCLRWDDFFGNGFTFTSITNNTADFPGLSITTLNNNITDSGYNNQYFGFTGLTGSARTYVQDSAYEVFRVTLGGSIPAAFQMVADNQSGPYHFTVTGEDDTDYTPQSVNPFTGITDSLGSLFFKTYTYSILSVGLTSFSGTVTDCNARLIWTTSAEMRDNRFEIQQNINGSGFTALKAIPGSGASGNLAYITTVPMQPGQNYFRLKIISPGGQEQYSDIISLKNACGNSFQVQAAPNLVTGGMACLLVTAGTVSTLEIWVTDMAGHPVKQFVQRVAAGTSRIQLPVTGLPGGPYIITVNSSGNGRITQKIFIQ